MNALTVFVFLLVWLVVVFILTRDTVPDVPGVSLNELGYRLIASKPNADGLCTFKIVDRDGVTIAHTDAPGTLDEAFAMASKFIAEMEEDYVTNNS